MTDLISVFTPSHQPRFLDDCLRSLLAQTVEDWEWVVVLNRGARWAPPRNDPRIRLSIQDDLGGVGAAKGHACSLASGDLLVELDHDDELEPAALEEIVRAFSDHPEASMVYSDFLEINEGGNPDPSDGDAVFGYQYLEDGTFVSMAPTPHNVSLMWFAPNHVRAFPLWAYQQAGGYDPAFSVLDDQDLMARLYLLGPFVHIPRRLYRQRLWSNNTQNVPVVAAFSERRTLELYQRDIQRLALAWAGRLNLLALDLGVGHKPAPGFIGVDVDLKGCVDDLAPLPDSSAGVIRAVDLFHRVADLVGLMNECYRVLAPGGLLLSLTPSIDAAVVRYYTDACLAQ